MRVTSSRLPPMIVVGGLCFAWGGYMTNKLPVKKRQLLSSDIWIVLLLINFAALYFVPGGFKSLFLALLTGFFLLAGLISLVRPIKRLGITSRKAGVLWILFAMGLLIILNPYVDAHNPLQQQLASEKAENKLKTENPAAYEKLQKEKAEKQKQKELEAKQRDKEAAEKAQREYKEQHPVDLKIISWQKGGFETVLLLNAKLTNTADYPIKDIVIACDMFADSKTLLGSAMQTLYRPIPAKKSIQINEFNMGFVHSQARRIRCEVIGFTPAGV